MIKKVPPPLSWHCTKEVPLGLLFDIWYSSIDPADEEGFLYPPRDPLIDLGLESPGPDAVRKCKPASAALAPKHRHGSDGHGRSYLEARTPAIRCPGGIAHLDSLFVIRGLRMNDHNFFNRTFHT